MSPGQGILHYFPTRRYNSILSTGGMASLAFHPPSSWIQVSVVAQSWRARPRSPFRWWKPLKSIQWLNWSNTEKKDQLSMSKDSLFKLLILLTWGNIYTHLDIFCFYWDMWLGKELGGQRQEEGKVGLVSGNGHAHIAKDVEDILPTPTKRGMKQKAAAYQHFYWAAML